MQLMTTPILSRETDPVTSDEAAAAQLWKMTEAHNAILAIFREKKAGLTDTELNKLYKRIWVKRDFPQMAFDSPRRRRSDLAGRKYLVESPRPKRRNENGKLEAVWVLASEAPAGQMSFDFDAAAA